MRITAFAALAVLAHDVFALPIRSSMPLGKDSGNIQKHQIEDLPPIETTSTGLPFNSHPDDLEEFPTIVDDSPDGGPKRETNFTVSSQHSSGSISQPAEGSHKLDYNYTDIANLLNDLLSKYNQHESKHLKRWVPRLDTAGKALNRFQPHNSTIPLDNEKAQLIIDQLRADIRKSHASSYKSNSPQHELAAIHKAEDRLRALNITSDASLGYGKKLHDDCYKIHGSRHRQEACAREAKKKISGPTFHNQISWNSTAFLGKRATTEDVSDEAAASQAVQRRDGDPTPDPVWLNKFLFPEQENSLPKRNEKRWESKGFGNMEYEDPETHETFDVDLEADWFSGSVQSHAANDEDRFITHTNSSANLPANRDLANQVRKLKNETEAKIAKPFIEFKNATEDPTNAIQDAVERFTARIQKYNSKMPGKMNVTTTFDPSKHRKRGVPESVRKLENQIGSKISEPYNELPEHFPESNNSTKRALNVTEKIYEELYKDEDFQSYLEQLNSTSQGFELKGKLLDTLSKDDDTRHFFESLAGEEYILHNSAQCSPSNSYNQNLESTKPRVHSREIQLPSGGQKNCRDRAETAEMAFSQKWNSFWYDRDTKLWAKKHPNGFETKQNDWIEPEVEKKLTKQMIEELKEDMKDPKNKWYIPEDKRVY